jgi:hypothetical protein
MAKIDLGNTEQSADQIPQITQSRNESAEMQKLLDSVRKNSSLNQQEFVEQKTYENQKKSNVQEENNEEEVDSISKKLAEFFNVNDNYHSIFIGDFEFVVKNLESTHFLQGALKLIDPALIKEDSDGYMKAFKEMYQYFIRALVCIKKGKDKITPEILTRGMPKHVNGYYEELGKSLSDYLSLDQLVQLVAEYTAFFNKVEIPTIEKKTK